MSAHRDAVIDNASSGKGLSETEDLSQRDYMRLATMDPVSAKGREEVSSLCLCVCVFFSPKET